MVLVTLLLRDLRSGQRMTAEFETLDSCREWLMARPQFIDVLGPTNEDLTPEGDRLLRTALRPYDAAERELVDQQRQQRVEELNASKAAARSMLFKDEGAERKRIEQLHPNDPMTVIWLLGEPVRNAEPRDSRPVPKAVVDAVAEWVAERNTWVQGRGQTVCAAQVTVWPGDVPPGQDRVQVGGQFEVQ